MKTVQGFPYRCRLLEPRGLGIPKGWDFLVRTISGNDVITTDKTSSLNHLLEKRYRETRIRLSEQFFSSFPKIYFDFRFESFFTSGLI